MIKFTLTVDGNYLLYSTLSVLQLFSKNNDMFLKSSDEEELRKDTNILLEKLTQVYSKDVRSMGPIIEDVVIAVDDSNSWRKDLYLTKNYKGIGRDLKYKGNREKDESLNWTLIFEVFNNFLKGLALHSGVKFKSIPGAEADDLLFVYASYLNSLGKNVIIYSGDGDLKQCVGFDKSKNTFTIQYQKQNRKIWVDRETAVFLKENKSSYSVDCIRSVVNNTSSTLAVVNPFEVVISKVIGGDKSDNIHSIIMESKQYKTGKKEGQLYDSSIGDAVNAKIQKEIEFCNYSEEDLFRKEFRQKIASASIRNFKSQNKYSLEDIENNVDVNATLVLLHKDMIPESIYNEIYDWAEVVESKKKSEINKQFDYKKLLVAMSMYDKKEHDDSNSASIFRELGL